MMFDQSNQLVYPFIDQYVPWQNGIAAFVEDGDPVVAVQNQTDTYRTFCFSYALAELADNETTTREDLLTAILEFFGFPYTGISQQINAADLKVSTSPNPFNDRVQIAYELQESCKVVLSVHNIYGELMGTLVSNEQQSGRHQVEWNAEGLPPGIYFYRISTIDHRQSASGKMVLVK
jgi:hypothetical protein